MRYYDITVSDEETGKVYRQWTSYPNGQYDAQALDVEFDMPIMPANQSTAVTITIYGISLQDLNESTQFAKKTLTIKGGMKGGLPLENPAQSGLLMKGQIFQSFGNWVGTDMTLDLVVFPSLYTIENPGNMVVNWKAGTTLSDTLQQTLSVAFPNMPASININNDLVNNYDVVHYCSTLDQLGDFVNQFATGKFKNPVTMAAQQGMITVSDVTYTPKTVELDFNDLIGQPTWIDVQQIQVKTVLRSDITIGSIIRMPKGLKNAPGFITTNYQSLSAIEKYKSTFQNGFTVNSVRHIGSSRSSDAGAWATIFQAYQNQS